MRPSELIEALKFSLLVNNEPILIKGKPGIGKSDIVEQACAQLGYELLIVHPVVEDPTDAKGMPWVVDGEANFIPFGNLKRMKNATSPLVVLIDDFGQSAPSMQAAYMQLLLSRSINGQKISEHVRFVSATNRREDKAAVSGLLEPVKSRFASIVELEVSTIDWVDWALKNNMPTELISFIQFKPELLDKFEATRDIKNSPSPRTVAFVGKMLRRGLPESLKYEMITGAAGESFAVEFLAFVKLMMNLPSIGEIELNPATTIIPSAAGAQYALAGAIADRMHEHNMDNLMEYLHRLPKEIMVASVKMGTSKNPATCNTRAFQAFQVEFTKMFN